MAKLTKAQIAARKRLLEDFAFYCKHAVKIRTKSGEIKPLILNKVQKRFVKRIAAQEQSTGKARFVVLKARQQGLSTVISAYNWFKVSQRKGLKGLVIAHEKDSSDALFGMYRRMYENVPEMLRPEKKFSNKRELSFHTLDSGLIVDTAGGKGVARGETLQLMHLSEVAFWPANFAKANFNGLIQALPDADGTACFVESTANGVTGQFYDLWNGAAAGINGFEPFFSAWFESDEYREAPPEGTVFTHEEHELAAKYGLDDEQLYWRRRKVATNGIELFQQEYPSTAEEAFITSGRPVFDVQRLLDMRATATPLLTRMAAEPDEKGVLRIVAHPRGELHVYHERQAAETYYIGVDVAVGIKDPDKADWSVAQVLDSHKRQVAVWRGQLAPDHLAYTLKALGEYYNLATVAPERNGHGLLVCVRLWKDLSYPNCFFDLKEGEIADRGHARHRLPDQRVISKPLIIDKLRGEVREQQIEINDPVHAQRDALFRRHRDRQDASGAGLLRRHRDGARHRQSHS
jgi:hypothetical protein